MLMLSGTELGQALVKAMKLKNVGPTEVARAFGVKPPSVKGWQSSGTIHKKHLTKLVEYFSDVVQPSHWGLSDREVKTFGITPDLQEHPEFDAAADAHLRAVALAEGSSLTTGAKMLALAFDQLDDSVKYAAFEYLTGEIQRIKAGKTRLINGG